jgi:hypothetical protein
MIRDDHRVVRKEARDTSASLKPLRRCSRVSLKLVWLMTCGANAYPTMRLPKSLPRLSGPLLYSLVQSHIPTGAHRELASGL